MEKSLGSGARLSVWWRRRLSISQRRRRHRIKAVGYIRVSSEKQAREGVSLDNQRAKIEAYCQYKDLELLGIIADEGVSGGKNRDREGFARILSRIEHSDVDVVVVYSLDRLLIA